MKDILEYIMLTFLLLTALSIIACCVVITIKFFITKGIVTGLLVMTVSFGILSILAITAYELVSEMEM